MSENLMATRPIFIVGCPRSGTTLLRLILDSHPNISCGPETHIIRDFARLLDSRWKDLSRFGLPRSYWVDAFSRLFDEFQQQYARSRGRKRWADKTPAYSLHLDFISQLFPSAQIVHVVRDPAGVVASHRDRWGYRAAMKAPAKWTTYVETARKAGDSIGPQRYYEISYEEVVTRPEQTLEPLFAFLGEPWTQAVLHFHTRNHDVDERYARFTNQRRREGSDDSEIYQSRVSAGNKLDPFLRFLVSLKTEPLRTQLGYK